MYIQSLVILRFLPQIFLFVIIQIAFAEEHRRAPRDNSSTESILVSPPTAQQAGTGQTSLSRFTSSALYSSSLALTHKDVARIIIEQITLAFQALRVKNSQTPLILRDYKRTGQGQDQDTVISSIKPITTYQASYRDSPIHGTDAQELSNKSVHPHSAHPPIPLT